MISTLGSADYVVIALALGSLAVVLWEIAVKAPRSFLEMLADSRSFAERPLTGAGQPPVSQPAAAPVALHSVAAAPQPQTEGRRLAA